MGIALQRELIVLFLVLVIGTPGFAAPGTTVVSNIPQPDGTHTVLTMTQADGVENVEELVTATRSMAGSRHYFVGYIYPGIKRTDGLQVESKAEVEKTIKVGKFRHALSISLIWGVSAFSVIVFSHAPDAARYANLGFSALVSMSRIFREDWQGDLVSHFDEYLSTKLSHPKAEKLNKELRITTMASQFVMSFSMGFLSYNAQLMASTGKFGWEFAVLSGALVATAAAGPWEDIFKRWIRGEDSPVSVEWSYHLRDLRRLLSALAGPHIYASEGGAEKFVAQTYYFAIGALGIRAFYLDPVRLQKFVVLQKERMQKNMSNWRKKYAGISRSCNIFR